MKLHAVVMACAILLCALVPARTLAQPSATEPIAVRVDGTLVSTHAANAAISVNVGSIGANATKSLRISDEYFAGDASIGVVTVSGTSDETGELRVWVTGDSYFPPVPSAYIFSDGSYNFAGLTVSTDSLRKRTRFAASVRNEISGTIAVGQVQRIQAGNASGTSMPSGIISANITAIAKNKSFTDSFGQSDDVAIGEIESNDLISGTIHATGEVESPFVTETTASVSVVRVYNATTARGIRSSILAPKGEITKVSSSGPIGTSTARPQFVARDGVGQVLASTWNFSDDNIIAQPLNVDIDTSNGQALTATTGNIGSIVTEGSFKGDIKGGRLELLSVRGDFEGSMDLWLISGFSTSSVSDDDYEGKSGILIRGACDAPIRIRSAVDISSIVATSFRHPITIDWYLKGCIVAADNSTTTSDSLAGTIHSVRIGFDPPQYVLDVSDYEAKWGFIGIDFASPHVSNAQTIDEWLAAPTPDEEAKDAVIRASQSIGAAAAGATPARGVEIARMSRSYVTVEDKFGVPRIESKVIHKLYVPKMYDASIWSGVLDGLPNVAGTRDQSKDFAVIDEFTAGTIGPSSRVFLKNCPLIRVQANHYGELHLPSLASTETIQIDGRLGAGVCGTGFFQNPPYSANEDSPRHVTCAAKGSVRIDNTTGLHGQIIINAAQTVTESFQNGANYPWDAWQGEVVVGAAGTPITLSPASTNPLTHAPNYQTTPAALGGGAVGVVPFLAHFAACTPTLPDPITSFSNASPSVFPSSFGLHNTTGNSLVPVKIEFYGPIDWDIEQSPIEVDGIPIILESTPCTRAVTWQDFTASFHVRFPDDALVDHPRQIGLSRVPIPGNDPTKFLNIGAGLYRMRFPGLVCAGINGNPPVSVTQQCSNTPSAFITQTQAFYLRVGPDCDEDGNDDTLDTPSGCASNACADFNNSGGAATIQDLFDFLAAWFQGCTQVIYSPPGPCQYGSADFNNSGGSPTVQDIFDYLAAWFGGC